MFRYFNIKINKCRDFLPESVNNVLKIVKVNFKAKVREIEELASISIGCAWMVLQKTLGLKKSSPNRCCVSSLWDKTNNEATIQRTITGYSP